MIDEEGIKNMGEFYQVIDTDIKAMWKMYGKIDPNIRNCLSFEKYCDIVMKKEEIDTIRRLEDGDN